MLLHPSFHRFLPLQAMPALVKIGRYQRVTGLLFLCITAAGLGFPRLATGDDWTNLEGTATIQGDFLGMWGDKVILRRTNGKKVAIESSKLNATSRLRAEELAQLKADRRQERISDLNTETEKSVEVPKAKASAPFESPADGLDLGATAEYLFTQFQAGHPRVFWDLLPPTYQTDIQEVVRLSVQATDPEQNLANLRLLGQLARTLNKQRDFVFGYPMLSMLPPEPLDMLQKAYGPVVGILTALADTETFSVENITNANLGEIIAKKDEEMGPHIANLLKLIPEEQNPMSAILLAGASSVQMDGSDRGSLSYTDPSGQLITTWFIRVEDRWVPEAMAQGWQDSMASARQALAQQAMQSQEASATAAMVNLTLGAALTQIEDASTQEEFNEIVDRFAGVIMSAIPHNPGGSFAGGGGSGGASPSGFNPPSLGGVDSGGGINSGGGGLIPGPGSSPNSGGASGPPGIAPAGVSSGGG